MADTRRDWDVLIVEDDVDLANTLAQMVKGVCERVRTAVTGAQALLSVREHPPALVLLDLGLPDIDGMSVCKEIVGLQGPRVIVITGRDDARTAETALELGADDYVRKPFHLNELRARVRAALRRRSLPSQGVMRVGPLEIDPDRALVKVDGRLVELSATELRLLMFFAEHPGWVFSKERLLEALWPQDRDAHAVQVHISNLRQKIEPDPRRPRVILTVKGLGYKLAV
ncbi:MAG: response regulator transcription factor [Armatimonadetes bacterium]|nr:response regulator transcription factor [Armatimonadota bacterium]